MGSEPAAHPSGEGTSVIDSEALLADGKKLVRSLVDDLRGEATIDPAAAGFIAEQYRGARAAGRTALSASEWVEGLYAQVAVAWFLGCVFARFCEDNGLVDDALLSGPGPRRAIALEHRSAYLAEHPDHDDRHWLRHVFGTYRRLPATGDLFGSHNPVWNLSLSADGARELRELFQRIDPESGLLQHDFSDPSWETRFLGDLYQDLSEYAQKFYALLQTPVFVEEFILDHTLDPAIATFGLREVTIIDPTCGSGHFLLGAFARLYDRWVEAEPSTNRRELARRALDAIAGVDLNPFAAAIARFRLLVVALHAGGDTRLVDAPAYPIHVAVGDSLLHGDPPGRLPGTLVHHEAIGAAVHGYANEDVDAARALLSRSWHAVVGNPPYITVKDPALNQLYRDRFETCSGKYSLGVPFTERFWQLARFDPHLERAGYVGLITANSFMKREMGKKLVEKWFPLHDVTHVIDTSGAYIPGHGTPTVIVFGRNRAALQRSVRAVMGIRGEPGMADPPEKGLVWTSITELVDHAGASSDFISVVDLPRERLTHHPWSLGGGGAAELKQTLDEAGDQFRSILRSTPGFMSICGYDGAAVGPKFSLIRHGVEKSAVRPLIRGEDARDWRVNVLEEAFFPYVDRTDEVIRDESLPGALHRFWLLRSTLEKRHTFSGITFREAGRHWWEWHQLSKLRLRSSLFITFANVATHNHFVLSRGGCINNPHAPVIDLVEGKSEAEHLRALGTLNSSAGCFWMHQVFHNKGAGGGKRVEAGFSARGNEEWENHFEHDGTKLQSFPFPAMADGGTATLLDRLAQELQGVMPTRVARAGLPTASRLGEAAREYRRLRSGMIAAQERLDWEAYRWYGLVDEDLTTGAEPEPPLELGERAFEIVLARRVAAGEEETSWFTRHGSTPITQLPSHWPEWYRRLVERRIELIETDLNIGLIEKPEYKRRWAGRSWDQQVSDALRTWLLDRLESPVYWPEPAALTTCARLAAQARADAEFMEVAHLYKGADVDAAALITELVAAESVAYLAAYRYNDRGLRKHDEWLRTWELQRLEDAGQDVGSIPVPPKYVKGDFRGVTWEHRGKLDVPKERFISYPGAERESDPTPVVGWAGWDHLVRARALAVWYTQARREGRDGSHLLPLLVGLDELVPWLKQWYDQPDPDPALNRPGSQIAALVDAELRSLQLSRDDLASWKPEAPRRGRRPR